ncbi:MAG: tetratricopeptide repeat protein [Flavobacteriales bacterium]|nr:tetratricopeptide repeat protein [Flavobacteriales bacterium]
MEGYSQYAPEQQREIDSLTSLLGNASDDTTKINLRYQIGETAWLFRTSYWDSISNDCIQLMAKPTVSDQEKEAYRNSLAATFNNTGFIYNNQGEVSQALKYFFRSLKLYEDLVDGQGIARASNNIGLIYHEQGNIPMALKYYHKSLKIREKLGNKRGIANSLNDIGFIYESQKNVPMALMYLRRSLTIYQELGEKQGVASSSNSIGVIQQRQGEINEAKELHEQALIIQEEIGDKDRITHSLNNIAEIALIQGDVKLAERYAARSLKLSKELGFPSPISNASKILSAISKKSGNYKIGWEHFEVFIKMRDSARSQETEKAVVEQEMKYEYEKIALKDSLEDAQIQAVKDSKIKEQNAIIKQDRTQKIALYGGLILMVVLILFGVKAYQQKKKDNLLIHNQKLEVEEKNKEITDSITYAKRIQEAILPSTSELDKYLKNGFVLFKPKDIVAGDFYWLEVINDVVYYAAADCTGHGVPGAMVSVVCHGALNRAVREFKLTEPAQILDKVRELVIETFKTSKDDVKDGMDIALCALNFKTNLLNFSGANNSLYIISNGKVDEIKADKQPIGRYVTSEPFTNHQIQLNKGDSIYVFTDGYADQFGGPKGKKFKYEPFRTMLLNNQDKDMNEQKELLDTQFEKWKGDLEQVDDVCVIGVKI